MIQAIVPVFGDMVHQWVGSNHVLDLLLTKLDAIRELDQVIVVSDQIADARGYISDLSLDTTVIWHEEASRAQTLAITCCHVSRRVTVETSDPPVILGVDPAFPFLDREKIEAILYAVQHDKQKSAFTVAGNWAMAYRDGGDWLLHPEPNYVDACIAIRGSNEVRMLMPGPSKAVLITTIEAINLYDNAGRGIANAVVTGLI